MSGDYSSRNRRMLKRFLPYYKKYSGLFALDMFCSALTTVCEIALPLIVRQITDRAAVLGSNFDAVDSKGEPVMAGRAAAVILEEEPEEKT